MPKTATNPALIKGMTASLRVRSQDKSRASTVAAMKMPVAKKMPPSQLARKKEIRGPASMRILTTGFILQDLQWHAKRHRHRRVADPRCLRRRRWREWEA